jgi:uncharacterized membrane protein
MGGAVQAEGEADVGTADVRLPGTLLGIGLGGFVDGILLHQVLQWHHMLTSTDTDNLGVAYYPVDTVQGLKVNTVWDGLFHTVTWLAVLTGLALLYSRVTHSRGRVWASRALWGWVLVGWGLFNLVEGVVDHHVLGIHHVRSGEYQTWWDIGFLVLGALLVAGGWLLQRGAAVLNLADRHAAAAG